MDLVQVSGRMSRFLKFSFWLPWQLEFCMEWKSLNNFQGDHPGTVPVKFDEIPLFKAVQMLFKVNC